MSLIEKHAINIVIKLIDKRIKWLKNNEPSAIKEIEAYWNASSLLLELN